MPLRSLRSLRPLAFLDELIALRHDLHQHPELAFAETRTANIVASELERYGLTVHRGLAKTGVVGLLQKGKSARAIGLRADMDALPLQEKNVMAYASQRAGRMHGCGHDGHTAMLLGAARYLAENQDVLDFTGAVYFIFQPAEESEAGAMVMVREGLFDKFPMDAVFGLHNWPGLPVGQMAVMPGAVMASTCNFEILVRGKGCHGGMPHQGVDALLAASQLVVALQTIVARNLDPCDPAVVSVTQFHSGDALNIIPDEALLRGTIRCFKTEVQLAIEQAMARLCLGLGQTFGAQIELSFGQRYPPTINSAKEAALCHQSAVSLLGEGSVRGNESPSMGAEDFSFMLKEKPGCYVWLGNGADSGSESGAGSGVGSCALHNPHYDFNDAALPIGVNYWVQLVESALG